MLDYERHCHSTFSDGLPQLVELLARAACRGINFMALTDHGDISGLPKVAQTAAQHKKVGPRSFAIG